MASAVSQINGADAEALYKKLLHVAKRKTAEADVKFDERGKAVMADDVAEFGDNVLIVEQKPEQIFSEQISSNGKTESK